MFGEIVDGKMCLNDKGKMIKKEWNNLSQSFSNIEIDEYIVMPNHFHGILIINSNPVGARLRRVVAHNVITCDISKRAGTRPAPTEIKTIGNIIGAFKSITTHKYINGVKNHNWQPFNQKLWQRNFYEHIIRNEKDLNEICEYIQSNPMNWEIDEENPINKLYLYSQ